MIFAGITLTRSIYGMASAEVNNNRIKTEVKDGWFYVNGERFFIKGVNYCGWRPGESPHDLDPVDLKLADNDFKLIQRSRIQYYPHIRRINSGAYFIGQKHGLMVMHGIWFNRILIIAIRSRSSMPPAC